MLEEDQAKLHKASKILEQYEVGKNLTFILSEAQGYDVDGIEWDESFDPDTVPEVVFAIRFRHAAKTYELFTFNKGGSEDGYHADFTLGIDGNVVLMTRVNMGFSNWHRSVSTSPVFITVAKLGPWMENLQAICETFRIGIEAQKRAYKETELAEQAAGIDLGGYDVDETATTPLKWGSRT